MREKERGIWDCFLVSTNVCLEREREIFGWKWERWFWMYKRKRRLRVCLAPFGVSNKHEFYYSIVFYFVFFVYYFLIFWFLL